MVPIQTGSSAGNEKPCIRTRTPENRLSLCSGGFCSDHALKKRLHPFSRIHPAQHFFLRPNFLGSFISAVIIYYSAARKSQFPNLHIRSACPPDSGTAEKAQFFSRSPHQFFRKPQTLFRSIPGAAAFTLFRRILLRPRIEEEASSLLTIHPAQHFFLRPNFLGSFISAVIIYYSAARKSQFSNLHIRSTCPQDNGSAEFHFRSHETCRPIGPYFRFISPGYLKLQFSQKQV